MTELVIVTDDGPVRTVRMNRPEKKNALTMAMYDAMAAAHRERRANSGAALPADRRRPDAFCAGNDIGDFLQGRERRRRARARRSCASSMRWRAARGRWSPPCRATRSASAPPC